MHNHKTVGHVGTKVHSRGGDLSSPERIFINSLLGTKLLIPFSASKHIKTTETFGNFDFFFHFFFLSAHQVPICNRSP